MGKLRFQKPFGVVSSQVFNHLSASLVSREVLRKAASMGLQRVAPGTYLIPKFTRIMEGTRGNKR